jgi:preprotein translocase subunit Sec61beta
MRPSLAIDQLAAHHALSTLPEAWVDLVHGHVSVDEVVAAVPHEPQALVERSRMLFAPPSAAAEDQRLEALLAAHFPPHFPVAERPAASRGARSRWLSGGVLALVAAGLLLFFLVPPRDRAPVFDEGYALELSPGYLGERDQPGAEPGIVRYHVDQRIELRLRPRATVATTVGVVVFATTDGRDQVLAVDPEINLHGVVSIAGTPASLGLSAGRWALTVVVGPPTRLPAAREDVRGDPEAPYDVQTAEIEVVTVPDPPSP